MFLNSVVCDLHEGLNEQSEETDTNNRSTLKTTPGKSVKVISAVN